MFEYCLCITRQSGLKRAAVVAFFIGKSNESAARAMTILSKEEWREVEHAYCRTTEPVAKIAARFGVNTATINDHRKRNGWPPRRPKAVRGADGPVAVSHADLMTRFYGLISLKLEQMEEDMARSSERTPADNERETRALGTLIRNFEKVFGLEQETSRDGKQNGDKPEGHAEAEAIRRELAERLVRMRESKSNDTE